MPLGGTIRNSLTIWCKIRYKYSYMVLKCFFEVIVALGIDKDRLVYDVTDESIVILQCKGHYDDK